MDPQTCAQSSNIVDKIIGDYTVKNRGTRIGCTPAGYFVDDTQCASTVAALTEMSEAYVNGNFDGCRMTTPSTTATTQWAAALSCENYFNMDYLASSRGDCSKQAYFLDTLLKSCGVTDFTETLSCDVLGSSGSDSFHLKNRGSCLQFATHLGKIVDPWQVQAPALDCDAAGYLRINQNCSATVATLNTIVTAMTGDQDWSCPVATSTLTTTASSTASHSASSTPTSTQTSSMTSSTATSVIVPRESIIEAIIGQAPDVFNATVFEENMHLLVCLWGDEPNTGVRFSLDYESCLKALAIKVMGAALHVPSGRGSSRSRTRREGETQSQVLYYGRYDSQFLDASVIINATLLATLSFKERLFEFDYTSLAQPVVAKAPTTSGTTAAAATTTENAAAVETTDSGMKIAVIVVSCLCVVIMVSVIAIFVRARGKLLPSSAPTAGLSADQLDEWKSVTEALRNVPQSAYAPPQSTYADNLASPQSTYADNLALPQRTYADAADWELSKQVLEAHAKRASPNGENDTAVALADHAINTGWSDHAPATNRAHTMSPQLDTHSYLDVKSNMSRVLSPSPPNAGGGGDSWRPLTLYSEGAEELQNLFAGSPLPGGSNLKDPPRSVSAFVESPETDRERVVHSAVNELFLDSSIMQQSPPRVEVPPLQQQQQLESLKLMRELCQDQLASAQTDSAIDVELLKYAQSRIDSDLQGYLSIGDPDDDAKNTKLRSQALPDGMKSPVPGATAHFHPAELSSAGGNGTPSFWRGQGPAGGSLTPTLGAQYGAAPLAHVGSGTHYHPNSGML